MGHLRTFSGKRIVATQEVIPGRCEIADVGRIRGSDTNLIEHAGGTEIDWNGQKTAEYDGQRLFIDEDGHVWLEALLTYVDED